MMNWLVEDYGMSQREAYLHMTANSLVRINHLSVHDRLLHLRRRIP